MLFFFIVDAARIGWAWVTVQGAARAGARYASTGQSNCQDPPNRLDCIVDTVFNYMDTLKLHDDPQAPWGTDSAYRIEIWGVDENNQGPWPDYPGAPGKPVVVRAYHWVPIITPFFKPIRDNIPVYGQVTTVNEMFDSLGGSSAGIGLPPPLPPLPPAQPTATFTPTPSPTYTPTPTPTLTASLTPTASSTPAPTICFTHFEGLLLAGDASAAVTGNLDVPPSGVKLYDLSETATPGAARFIGAGTLDGGALGHDCLGFVSAPVSPTLQAHHLILVSNDFDGSWDTELVLPGTVTPTPTPTSTPTSTPSPTPTATPIAPYIRLNPACGFGAQVRFAVEGYNWNDPANAVNLFWIEEGGSPELQTIIPVGHPPDFIRPWTFSNVGTGIHTVEARSGGTIETATFEVPCDNPTDLVIGDPTVLNPPTAEHEPFQVQVVITNTGYIDTNQQFFIDVFLDPSEIYTDTIPLYQSDGYAAVASLAGGSTKTIIVSVPYGFESSANVNREVWVMIDSLEQIDELHEWNNIGGPTYITGLTASTPPTPTPAPSGSESVSGLVRTVPGGPTIPQARAQVWLVNSSSVAVASTFSGLDAFYQFTNVEAGTYSIFACIQIENSVYVGNRIGVIPTDPLADVFMTLNVAGCPY